MSQTVQGIIHFT